MKHRTEFTENLLCEIFEAPRSEATRDQAEYILSMTDAADVREWLLAVFDLDESDPRIDLFMGRKAEGEHRAIGVTQCGATGPSRNHHDKRGPSPRRNHDKPPSHMAPSVIHAPTVSLRAPVVVPAAKKTPRQICPCLAQTHSLLGSCLQCGRIVCAEEDYGDCLFCGADKNKDMHWSALSTSSSSSAIDQKNRLIQYDREGSQRTQVYDDATDWFAEADNVWRGKQERELAMKAAQELQQQQMQANQQLKISLDFKSGSISVVDKAIGIANVADSSKQLLHEYINHSAEDRPNDPTLPGKLLDQKSQSLLDELRMRYTRKNLPAVAAPSMSIFSFLDDE